MSGSAPMAYPVTGFRMAKSPEDGSIAVFQLQTIEGWQTFAGNREVLEALGNELLGQADELDR